MILVCGGLADSVTEFVCARLADCGYPYRLLDLGKYPAGFQIKWHWQGSSPTGYIAGPDEKIEKLDKFEKIEKPELKEIKNEKLEREGVFDPGSSVGPDPRIEQVIQAVTGLTRQVSQLANQVEELRKKVSG
jgi:hypothetical protein